MKRIRLLHSYSGKLTKEQRILPGQYDADDPAIFGLADYLVENGHALVIHDSVFEGHQGAVIDPPLPVAPETSKGFLTHTEAMEALGRTSKFVDADEILLTEDEAVDIAVPYSALEKERGPSVDDDESADEPPVEPEPKGGKKAKGKK